jgi:predicted unusual protein kinase regulating ubiquinone biosynthesis (AarF/ABC1/UbiB family)
MTETSTSDLPFYRGRYLRVVRYFAGVLAHFVLWQIILRHLLGRSFVERSASQRWQRIARRYRALAVEEGGLLIKLGQFLSVRVDVLPREVTAELSGLQDEVPAERLADIQSVVESEFGQPLDLVFTWFASEPEAAASLAQVHRARLLTGDLVVVKVQRPHIEATVETDLRAIRTAVRWLKHYRPIRRRVDLDRLYKEFSRTTRNELDFVAEGQNAERFAENLAGDTGVRIPHIYGETSTRRILIMEDVASIKITDFEAIESAGISRPQVARRLFDTYLKQIFLHNFVHADPHPGNLFIQPLETSPDHSKTAGNARQELEMDRSGAPFLLTFVDFGMVATVPQRMREHFRDYLLGFASKDAKRMVRAYQGAGVLLPGADIARLEEMEAELLDRYWGLTLSQAQELAMQEWQDLARDYRDILYEMPFQMPTDLLFLGRTLAILFGMATTLDPNFDPWQAIAPFAEQIGAQEAKRDWQGVLGELEGVARLLLSLPVQAERVLSQAARGELAVRTVWAPEATRTLLDLEMAVNRLGRAVIFAAFLLAAVAVYIAEGGGTASYILFLLAAVALLATLVRR